MIKHATNYALNFKAYSYYTKEHIEDYIINFDQYCSKETVLEQISGLMKLTEEIIESYRIGKLKDIIETEKQTVEYSRVVPEEHIEEHIDNMKAYVLRARNKHWLQKVTAYHNNEQIHNSFIAAGVLHFVKEAPFNMLDMLIEEDYTVKRMKADCSFE